MASVGAGSKEGEGSDNILGITPKARINHASRISHKDKHDRLV